MKHIAIIGECMIELNGTPFGAMEQAYGGDSLNTAVYIARTAGQSVAVDYISALGTDPISDGMLSRWQQEGVNTQWVLRDPARQPGLYLIQLDEEGERTFLYWRNQSAARFLLQHPSFTEVEAHLHTVDMVYVSGISLAILPAADRKKLLQLLQSLKHDGVEIAFDSNYRPALWQSAEEARSCYQQLLRITDLALVTDDDEMLLWGDKTHEETLARLHHAGAGQIVLKMGAKGCRYTDFSTLVSEHIATNPVENVIDTTSAGDSFNAGFLAGYLTGKTPRDAALQGHQLAGTVIQHKGAIIPSSATQTINFNTVLNSKKDYAS
ncbi:sugar kinase [Photobacterium sp. OFAV2-7]|uniref:sugar kinase n=1 Tax=Photobacterium sp. OFAV2-7 TaxID=2917748 RepID=UPI001EF5C519|nr:sugar kinase [Photobacterium sp. OFAV2-7]MCG7588145.1 sugar kinase [Photobacterium sp. OFAV2-7]